MAIVIKETRKAEPKRLFVRDLKPGDIFIGMGSRTGRCMRIGPGNHRLPVSHQPWAEFSIPSVALEGHKKNNFVLWATDTEVLKLFDAEVTMIEREVK